MRKDCVERVRDLRSKLNDEMLVLDQISSGFPTLKMKAVTEMVRSDFWAVDTLYLLRLGEEAFTTIEAGLQLDFAERLFRMIVRSRELLQAEIGKAGRYKSPTATLSLL